METYQAEFKCCNCKKIIYLRIPRGTTVEEHVEEEGLICERCGCVPVKIKEKKEDGKKGKGKD